jgi:hypothetical protein
MFLNDSIKDIRLGRQSLLANIISFLPQNFNMPGLFERNPQSKLKILSVAIFGHLLTSISISKKLFELELLICVDTSIQTDR